MKPSFEKKVNAWLLEVDRQMHDPDFWKLTGLFVVLFLLTVVFFLLAVRYDFFIRFTGSLGVACRQLGDIEAALLFISPFAIGLSFLVASGELISQMERKKRFRSSSLNWKPVLRAFLVAILLFSITGILMVVWC